MVKTVVSSLEDLSDVVNSVKQIIKDKDIVVLLQGTLASGKTTFVKEFVKSLGITQDVTSPTFSIQSCYKNDIYHYDIYNKSLQEFISLGLLEEFEKKGIHFVEWGDDELKNILDQYGFENLTIKINKYQNKREYIIET